MSRDMQIIGIDPDTEKSGVALLDVESRNVKVQTLDLPQLLDYCIEMHRQQKDKGINHVVVVEAGWLNKSNWHLLPKDSRQIAAAKGRQTGRNHQIGMDIVAILQAKGVPVVMKKPLAKGWGTKDGKISHEQIKAFMPGINHTNQEGRDAALLAWDYALLPIRITLPASKSEHREKAENSAKQKYLKKILGK